MICLRQLNSAISGSMNALTDRITDIKGVATKAAGFGVRMLFPPLCAGCRRIVAEPGTLCGECWPSIRFLERPWCEVMGTPFSHDMGEGFLSAEAAELGAQPMLRIDAVKALQQRWQAEAQSVPLDRRHEQKMWDAFRAPIDEAFNRKTAEREKASAAVSEHDRHVLNAALTQWRGMRGAHIARGVTGGGGEVGCRHDGHQSFWVSSRPLCRNFPLRLPLPPYERTQIFSGSRVTGTTPYVLAVHLQG